LRGALVALPTAAAAALILVLGYDGGTFTVANRASLAIVVWWALLLSVALGYWPVARIGRRALAVGGLLAAFGLWTLLSAIWSPDSESAFLEFDRVTLYLGVYALVVL